MIYWNINYVFLTLLLMLLQVFFEVLFRENRTNERQKSSVFWWKAVTLIHLTWCSALPDYSGDVHTAAFLLLFPSQEVHHILSLTPNCPPPSTAPPVLKITPIWAVSQRLYQRVTISRIRAELRCDWLPRWYRGCELTGQKVISLWRDYGRWLS